jgi:hypothetical protein
MVANEAARHFLQKQGSSDGSVKLEITHTRKRSMKRVPSLSSNGTGFFEVPASVIDTTERSKAAQMTIMKRRTQQDAALFAEQRYETLNQLFPSRTETYRPTSHINRLGSFSMGPLLPHGRRNTEDMEDDYQFTKENARNPESYRRSVNVRRLFR